MTNKNFLLLQGNVQDRYTLNDIAQWSNVIICHRKAVSDNKLLNFLFNLHYSGWINKHIELPLKHIWDSLLFDARLRKFTPDYIVFTTFWYSKHLLLYFREKCPRAKLILRFTDKVERGFPCTDNRIIEQIRSDFDGVLVYNLENASKYGFEYCSVGNSIVPAAQLRSVKKYDVVFIGAEKGRMDTIRYAYQLFRSAGLSCFFYVTMVKKEDRRKDGIIYADKAMSYLEYLSYEVAANCLFEIVQAGSSGRTFRMMEAIMYNKKLITNCPEIQKTEYYHPQFVQLYEDVSEINPHFAATGNGEVNYGYKGDFSPVHVLNFIANRW